MGLFKILRAAAVHNNKSVGGREGGREAEGGRRREKAGGVRKISRIVPEKSIARRWQEVQPN